ncbi:MAG: polysaccharide deacetylase family protein [Candidatus Pacearchaeota archaeon]|nr:polysaccharide deacetylase family protein [Candidatus Pacearchaeota archaeon]
MILETLALFLTSQAQPTSLPYWPYNQKLDLQQTLIQKEDSIIIDKVNEVKVEKNAKKFERPAVPILNYHWIVLETHKSAFQRYFQTKEQLRNTIRSMKKKGYNFISVSELEKLIANYDSTEFDTTRYALLTFDDGLECFYKNAYPILLEENVKATLFITTVAIRDSISGPYLSWKQIKEMYKSGLIDVQSHTHNSHVITGNNKSLVTSMKKGEDSLTYCLRLFADFFKSKEIIENKLGNRVIAIAWPFGWGNDVARRMAFLAGYSLYFGVNGENYNFGKKYKDLPRIEVGETKGRD